MWQQFKQSVIKPIAHKMPNKALMSSCVLAFCCVGAPVMAQGDLTRKPVALPDLVLGSALTDYAMSQKQYALAAGQSYKLNIVSSGLKAYAIEAA